MNYLDAVGQAHLDAAEGQVAVARALAAWFGRVTARLRRP